MGIIGLGKMGRPLAQNLSRDHQIFGFDINFQGERGAIHLCQGIKDLVAAVGHQGVYWIMVGHREVESVIDNLTENLGRGAVIIDAGNSSSQESLRRRENLAKRGLFFVEIGMSGGTEGAAGRPPIMLGCDSEIHQRLKPVLLTLGNHYCHFEEPGKAHLAKILHNTIEYGMMQSLAEGVGLYFHKGFTQQEIKNVFSVWSQGSIIESKLTSLIFQILQEEDLRDLLQISRSETLDLVKSSLGPTFSTPCLDKAVAARENIQNQEEIVESLLAHLRRRFGGHSTKGKDDYTGPRV